LVIELEIEPGKGFKRWLSKRNLGRMDHLQVELVDYPGEWLIDLPMLEQSYEDWSERMLKIASSPARTELSAGYLSLLQSLDMSGPVDEEIVSSLADGWAQYLFKAAEAGLTLNQPGRMLRPDTLKNSPVLRFAPIPAEIAAPKLRKHMTKRFDQYKKEVITPFYRDYFARIDRQIVLVDVVRALEQGEEVFLEMERALEETLRSFNYSKGGVLARLLGSRTSKVLFAATKADHVTRGDRANLENMLRGMLARVDESLPGKAERVGVMALASIRATEDYTTDHAPKREILRGKPAGEKEAGQWDPGGLPLDMPPDWEKVYFQFLRFEPPVTKNALLEGFPAINLGKALDFLIGEEIP
jgi:predicted YcjX-like family ATPase